MTARAECRHNDAMSPRPESGAAVSCGDAEPAVVVCTPANFGCISKLAFQRGSAHVFTLAEDGSGSLVERASHCSDQQQPVAREAHDGDLGWKARAAGS